MKVFISGRISSLPLERAKKQFEVAEWYLKEIKGYDTINPYKELEKYQPTTNDWYFFMGESIKLLKDADAIYMLHGWENSDGATVEYVTAQKKHLKIIFEDEENER